MTCKLPIGPAAALLILAAFAVPGSAIAGPAEEPPKAELATTGNDSEIEDSVPVATAPGSKQRVVMSLGPEELKRIEAGDRMRVSGEVQVSTTCVAPGPRCVGRRYEFNPTITAQIVLAAAADRKAFSIPLSGPRQALCKQRRPNRNHHCTITFPNVESTIADPSTLPCAANQCYVNMILSAANPAAKHGNRVVLGADRPDGSVEGDKGRLNVVQARADVPPPTEAFSAELVNSTLPLTEGKKVKRRVVHSIPIAAPKKGEVIAFDGSYQIGISALSYNAFISSLVVIAETPTSIEPSGVATQSTQLRGYATEGNGFNCTKGPSGYANPCASVKAGAIRFTEDAVDASGQPATLYLNLISAAKPLLTDEAEDPHRVGLTATGGLRAFRYSP